MTRRSPRPAPPALILYDADCGFCSSSVAWILRKHRDHSMLSLPSQSPQGRIWHSRLGWKERSPRSMVLVEGERAYVESSALLRIARRLSPPWNALGLLAVIPSPILDFAYRLVARHRRHPRLARWLNPSGPCPLPPATPSSRATTIEPAAQMG